MITITIPTWVLLTVGFCIGLPVTLMILYLAFIGFLFTREFK